MKKILLICSVALFLVGISACGTSDQSDDYQELETTCGEVVQLKTTLSGEVSWTSSDESIATVLNGVVYTKSIGTVLISATDGNNTTKLQLTVTGTSNSLKLSGKQTISKGNVSQLSAYLGDTATSNVTWSSSDANVASVSNAGVVSAVSTGMATITASLMSNSLISASISILVISEEGSDVTNSVQFDSYEVTGTLDLNNLSNQIVDVVTRGTEAVVGVSNYQNVTTGYGPSATIVSSLDSVGSGVIYQKETLAEGYRYTLLTNYHVIEDNDKLAVYFGEDESEITVETIVKTSATLDLAILTFVSTRDITPVSFATSNTLKAGDFVIAIGNPKGYDYYDTATFGIVSYVNRSVSNETALFIQHDAPINSGNSGGPLFNLDGEIIGINTLKIIADGVENMGFAISIDTLLTFIA